MIEFDHSYLLWKVMFRKCKMTLNIYCILLSHVLPFYWIDFFLIDTACIVVRTLLQSFTQTVIDYIHVRPSWTAICSKLDQTYRSAEGWRIWHITSIFDYEQHTAITDNGHSNDLHLGPYSHQWPFDTSFYDLQHPSSQPLDNKPWQLSYKLLRHSALTIWPRWGHLMAEEPQLLQWLLFCGTLAPFCGDHYLSWHWPKFITDNSHWCAVGSIFDSRHIKLVLICHNIMIPISKTNPKLYQFWHQHVGSHQKHPPFSYILSLQQIRSIL